MRTPAPLWERLQAPPLRRQGRVGEGCFLGSARTVDTPSQPPPAFAGGGTTAKLAAEAAPQDQERDRASGYPREGISNPRRTAARASPRSSQAATFPKRSTSTSSRASYTPIRLSTQPSVALSAMVYSSPMIQDRPPSRPSSPPPH